MAISTYQVFLMYKDGVDTEYKKLIDIKDFPDLGGAPEMLETTTLSDNMTTSIPGIQSLEALEFTCNYEYSDYQTLKAQELSDREKESKDDTTYAVWFGGDVDSAGKLTVTGDKGKFSFNGKLAVHTTGGGVNEVVNMVVTIAPSTPITFE